MGFQIKRHENCDEDNWQTVTGVSGIRMAVELAAQTFCHANAEYTDFQCFAREVGETTWRKFQVTIEPRPEFYANEVG